MSQTFYGYCLVLDFSNPLNRAITGARVVEPFKGELELVKGVPTFRIYGKTGKLLKKVHQVHLAYRGKIEQFDNYEDMIVSYQKAVTRESMKLNRVINEINSMKDSYQELVDASAYLKDI